MKKKLPRTEGGKAAVVASRLTSPSGCFLVKREATLVKVPKTWSRDQQQMSQKAGWDSWGGPRSPACLQ